MKKNLLIILLTALTSISMNAQGGTDFEKYTAGDDISTGDGKGWRVFNGTATVETDGFNKYVHCTPSGTDFMFARYFDNLEAGKTYVFSVDAKCSAKKYRVTFVTYSDIGITKVQNLWVLKENTTWENTTLELTLSESEIHVRAWVYCWPSDITVDIDNFSVTEKTATTINKASAHDVKITPNPSNGNFKLESNGTISSYTLFNTVGKAVKTGQTTGMSTINVNAGNLPKGIYIVQMIHTDGSVNTSRLVIK
ncbi:T9SS type A sorting domain-containing protein [Carboxylicivirga marina]|uniref:T9SS type A sorting domain-containing protein n=1 Tax=Carboxylicivirga marina TaxID=2800988 RepID=A0ABS1HMX0_9BACT|nr:T9SS type A sorting domain-containing protein [Carboxylicivirga marina]MBK3518887.1 T9SS type A sorting domain-containing protein [Carboxylicivirga marina]